MPTNERDLLVAVSTRDIWNVGFAYLPMAIYEARRRVKLGVPTAIARYSQSEWPFSSPR